MSNCVSGVGNQDFKTGGGGSGYERMRKFGKNVTVLNLNEESQDKLRIWFIFKNKILSLSMESPRNNNQLQAVSTFSISNWSLSTISH